MLQQTQVATVIPYFVRFIKSFPTLRSLATADEQEVLRHWEGLGYYRRARQLHRAARICVGEHGGDVPRDPAAVRALPGVGRYTAGAILSIAFDAREPILEANTLRLYSRLLAYRGDPRRTAAQRLLWELAEELLPQRRAGAFNQALMELGATICLPVSPRCDDCPVASLCPTRRLGLQRQVPLPKSKPVVEEVVEAAVVVKRRGNILLLRRGNEGRWAGLWDFPRFRLESGGEPETGELLRAELAAKVSAMTGLSIEPLRRLAVLRHGVTRFRITLHCHEARCVTMVRRKRSPAETRWVKPRDLGEYPLSVTGRKLAILIGQKD